MVPAFVGKHDVIRIVHYAELDETLEHYKDAVDDWVLYENTADEPVPLEMGPSQ